MTSPLKMDGWKTFSFPIGWNGLFSGANLLWSFQGSFQGVFPDLNLEGYKLPTWNFSPLKNGEGKGCGTGRPWKKNKQVSSFQYHPGFAGFRVLPFHHKRNVALKNWVETLNHQGSHNHNTWQSLGWEFYHVTRSIFFGGRKNCLSFFFSLQKNNLGLLISTDIMISWLQKAKPFIMLYRISRA